MKFRPLLFPLSVTALAGLNIARADLTSTTGTIDYLLPANYADGFVDGDITGNLTGNLIGTVAVDFTLPSSDTGTPSTTPDLVFTYNGSFNVTLQSSTTATRAMTLAGNVLVDSQTNNRTVTVGAANAGLLTQLGGADRTFTVATGDTLTFTNSVGSATSANIVTKEGSGVIQFNGSNGNYSGGYIQNAGTTRLGTSSVAAPGTSGPLGNGLVTLNAGRLQCNDGNSRSLSNSILIASNIAFGATATQTGALTFNAALLGTTTLGGAAGQRTLTVDSALTIAQPIGESVAGIGLIKAGNSSLTLSGTNTYTGDTTVNAGLLAIGSLSNLGAGVSGNDVTVNGPGRLTLGAASSLGASQILTLASTPAALAVIGVGYNGLPLFTSATAGVFGIDITNYTAIDDLAADLPANYLLGSTANGTFTGATLAPAAGNVYLLGGGGGTLGIGVANLLTGTASAEFGSALINGGGTVNFTATQDFSGPTVVRGPTPAFGASSAVNQQILGINVAEAFTNSAITLQSGAILAVRQNNALTSNVAVTTPVTLEPGSRVTVSNTLNNDPTAAINRDIFFPAGSSLEISPPSGLTGTGVITKAAGVTVRVNAATVLAGAQFNGSTIVPGDTLDIASTTGLTSGSITHAAGIRYLLNSAAALTGTSLPASSIIAGEVVQVNLDNPTNLANVQPGAIIEIFGANRTLTGSASLALDGEIITNDASSRQLNNGGTNANTLTSTTGFTLAATTGTTLSMQEDTVASGATVTIGSTTNQNGLAKAGTVSLLGSNTADSAGLLNVGTGIVDVVAGTLLFNSGGNNNITAATLRVRSGAFYIATTGTVAAATLSLDSGGTARLSGANPGGGGTNNINGLEGAGSVIIGQVVGVPTAITLSVGAGNGTTTFSGPISQETNVTAALTKVGTGTLTLSGPLSYSGNTTVNAGVLSLGQVNTANDASRITIAETGATLDLTHGGLEVVDELFIGTNQQADNTIYKAAGNPNPGTVLAQLTGTGRIQVGNITTGNDYAAWIGMFPGVGAMTGVNDDPENDGLDNGVEAILGSNPTTFSAGLVQISATASSATFRHEQTNTAVSDVTKSYQFSTDLTEWQSSGQTTTGGTTATISETTITDNTAPANDVIEVIANVTAGPSSKVFVRLVATKTP